MALTNFGTLTGDQLQTWSRDFWKVARNQSFINQFAGSGSNAMVQRVTELTKNNKGTKANITLLADMTGDGITGDYTLEGNEEALRAYDISIELDQLRFANRIAGRMTDQKTVVNFREQSRDALAYAIADRCDQLAFLTLSGVAYTHKNNGGLRTVVGGAVNGQELVDLEFASDVSAPTASRHRRVDGDNILAGDTTALVAGDTLKYKHIVNLKAYAKDQYIRGIRGAGNQETYHMFVTPSQMANLKLDTDFIANVRNAGVRGASNSLFAGSSSLMVDGVMIHEFRHVFNTSGATTGASGNAGAAGYKWGAAANVVGGRALFCGAQALALADIGLPEMVEDTFDYGNQSGISVGKIFGFRKPKYNSDITGDVQDFGVICLDTAQ
jgi:N4-gp56 family major capsid protein|tara:strand:- start:1951 stop:3102 length:1152 start_codon:yes stop_codon:yes gene_type:complete